MKQLNFAVVGFGKQFRSDHLQSLIDNPSAKLVAVVDPQISQDDLIALQDVRLYPNSNELLKHEQIDAAIIATPHFTHFNITKKFLENKIAVLKEKPLAITLDEAKKLENLSKKNNVPLLTNVQRRLMPHYLEGLTFLEEIGTPFLVEGIYHIYVDDPHSGWRGQKKYAGGGCIIDMGYHLIDVLNLYLGIPEKVIALSTTKAMPTEKYDAEDTATILLNYTDRKITGYLSISRFQGPKTEYLKITGDKGILEVTKKGVALLDNAGNQIKQILATEPIDSITHFIKVIKEKEDSLLSVNYQIGNMALIEAAYKSII